MIELFKSGYRVHTEINAMVVETSAACNLQPAQLVTRFGTIMPTPNSLPEINNRTQWREWLAINHALQSEAWLTIFKKKYQD